ncbi:MAG: hypothetical protein AB8G05_03430 [Oligoflexales bacterium]
MEFLVNNKTLGWVKNLVKEQGFDRFETKTYLGGITKEFFVGHQADIISFEYEGEWPECQKKDIWQLKDDDGKLIDFLPTDLISSFTPNQLVVKGELTKHQA